MSKFALADNVKETTVTTLTGTVSLLGAFNTSSKTFVNGIGSTYLTAYKIDDGAGNWENRFGVIASGVPDTITNAGFISSSSGSPVSFGAGTKTVTCVPMSELFLTAAISPVLVETDIASATTTDLGSIQTLRARITGTTTITGFGASPNSLRFVRFAGALTLTHDATTLILRGGANRTTVAGDVGLYVSDGSANWRELFYSNSSAAVSTRQVLTSGSSATYTTPAGVRQLRIRMLAGGGGGASNAVTASNGSIGGTTSFNGITVIGGGGGNSNGNPSAGGTGGSNTPSGGSVTGISRVNGNGGYTGVNGTASTSANGGAGGPGIFGGGIGSGSASVNSGAGGPGGSISGAANYSGGGGGSGEYVEFFINSPSGTYTYTIGAAGNAGTGGGNGGSGVIIVDEMY